MDFYPWEFESFTTMDWHLWAFLLHHHYHIFNQVSLSQRATCHILSGHKESTSLFEAVCIQPSPDVSHLESYPANVPPSPECLTSGNPIRPTSPPSPDVSHPESYPANFPIRMSRIRNSCLTDIPPPPDASHPKSYPAEVSPSPDVSHPEFCPSPFHLIWMSRIRNFCPAAIPPYPNVSHPESCPPPFYHFRMSHIRNSIRPTFHLLRMSLIRNFVRPTFNLLRISHVQRLTPDGRGDDSTSPVRHVRILIL
uniref:Uncharacterized protein n=1 Tax=Vitis vinifera TaxID=29760 RepID=A5B175_VITVI|nr:hypothetical protein VITISV_031497 [Vitis vinifera]